MVALDWGRSGLRVVIDQIRSGGLPDPPARIRVLIRKGADTVQVGSGIGLTAQLMPPPGPPAPGDSDFARAAFFARIGATGFAFGAPDKTLRGARALSLGAGGGPGGNNAGTA